MNQRFRGINLIFTPMDQEQDDDCIYAIDKKQLDTWFSRLCILQQWSETPSLNGK